MCLHGAVCGVFRPDGATVLCDSAIQGDGDIISSSDDWLMFNAAFLIVEYFLFGPL